MSINDLKKKLQEVKMEVGYINVDKTIELIKKQYSLKEQLEKEMES